VLGENGEVAHIVHSVVDVTQNIHLEKREQEAILQLDAERRRLYDLFMQAPAAVLIVSGHDHIVELANPMTLAFWRKTSDEVIGKPMLRAFPEAQGQGFDQIIEGVFRTGEPFLGEAQQVLRDQSDDGNSNSSYFTFVFVPVRGHTDEVEGVMAFAYDVTAQVLARERIEELARQKDEFLSIVSHELKTPVTSVKAYTQVLRNRFTRAGDKDAAAMLAKMDTQLNKLRGLIGDLVDITALETGKLQFQQEPFDFNALVAEVVEEMQRTTERHSIICRTPQPCTIVGDRDRTGQVLTNFLSNAIKYSPDADTVLVTTAATQKAATACVQDFGIGIPRGMQNQVFERFYRADRSTLDTYPGIGLGLYICAEIVRRLQGRIWVESEIGKGSTFCFELPLERAGAVAEQD
jgi:signal transduction histidine kinase